MKTIVVTGGAGFIGSNFIRLLLAERDFKLVVLDKLTYAGSRENLRGVLDDPRLIFVEGDIADREAVREVFRDHSPDAVVNFAAESHVDRSIDDPAAFVRTNVMGTFELLDAARHHRDGLRDGAPERADAFRFLHVSTDEVFGSLGETGFFTETTPYAPNSPYSASKAGADHLVRAWFHTFGLPTVTTNCSNNYGPRQFPEKLIPLMILNTVEGRDLPIYGDGSNVRDWIYVEDHCRGVLAALERGVPGECYVFGGRSERTNLEIVQRICDEVERRLPAADNPALEARGLDSYHQLQTFVTDRPGHDQRYAIDDGKAREALGWEPRETLDSGLAATVDWYLDHGDWCRAIQEEKGYGRERLGTTDETAEDDTKETP